MVARSVRIRCIAVAVITGSACQSAVGGPWNGEHEDGRRRERQAGERRSERVGVAFSPAELAVVRTAAGREGMASAAWAGRQVMAVAQHALVPVSRDASDVLRELIAARVHLRETVTALRALAAADPPAAGCGRRGGGAGPGGGGPGGCGEGGGDAGEAPAVVMPKKAPGRVGDGRAPGVPLRSRRARRARRPPPDRRLGPGPALPGPRPRPDVARRPGPAPGRPRRSAARPAPAGARVARLGPQRRRRPPLVGRRVAGGRGRDGAHRGHRRARRRTGLPVGRGTARGRSHPHRGDPRPSGRPASPGARGHP